MHPDSDYTLMRSVSLPPDRRPIFSTSLAQLCQRYPFITTSGFVVQAVTEVIEMDQCGCPSDSETDERN